MMNHGTELVVVYPDAGAVGVLTRAAVVGDRLQLLGYRGQLDARSAVEWRGQRYAISGDPQIYNGSPRTARAEYVMIRK